VVVFQLITLPVEFDASARAKQVLAETGIIADPDEMEGVRSVLSAAGWTYVAAALAALMQLLYYAWVLGLFGRRND
jgi:Zn-dependent membrane protease YugP